MKSSNLSRLLVAALTLGLAIGVSAMNESFTYTGRIVPMNGHSFNGQSPVTLTFRLYDQAEGGTVLWGRRYPVVVATDGTFTLNVSSTEGTSVSDAAYRDLALACASTTNSLYLGLTPAAADDDTDAEFKPRQLLGTAPRAYLAAVACAVDTMRVSELTATNGALTVKSGTVGVLNLRDGSASSSLTEAHLVLTADATLVVGTNATVTIGSKFFTHTLDNDMRPVDRVSYDDATGLILSSPVHVAVDNTNSVAQVFSSSALLATNREGSVCYPARFGTYFVRPGESFARSSADATVLKFEKLGEAK